MQKVVFLEEFFELVQISVQAGDLEYRYIPGSGHFLFGLPGS